MGIELSIIAGLCYASSSVNASGTDQHPVSAAETALFGLGDEALREAVGACLGEPPDLAQLDGFLHHSHGWSPVTTSLVVQSASVTGVGSDPVTMPLAGGARLTCTVANLWSPTDGISPTEPVRYHVQFPAGGGSLDYTHDWGIGTIESSAADLPPADAELLALRMNLGVRIVYDAFLTGEVAVHYRDGHQGHRFWALDIGTVLAAGGRRNGRHFAENLSVRYYASARVVHPDPAGHLATMAGPGIRIGADLALSGS